MRINHNITSMNAHAQMTSNSAMASKNMEKLSSGLRINKAGDDAAGLAISEKMRAQVRGLDQASRNSQDAISMIQTAEGALNESQAILQRMRELATQAGNDTNVAVDRNEIQKEINQLSSEINRIGNTTEFNTQKLLKGGGTTGVARTGLVSDSALSGGAAQVKTQTEVQIKLGSISGNIPKDNETISIGIGGQTLTVRFRASGTSNQATNNAYNITGDSATVNVKGLSGGQTTFAGTNGTVGEHFESSVKAMAEALSKVVEANDSLRGNVSIGYTGTGSGTKLVVKAAEGGTFDGVAGKVNASGSVVAESGSALKNAKGLVTDQLAGTAVGTSGGAAVLTVVTNGNTTDPVVAQKNIDLSSLSSSGLIKGQVGNGLTVNGKSIEFYDATKGSYTGNNVGVNVAGISTASGLASAITNQVAGKIEGVAVNYSGNNLKITAQTAGVAGNTLKVSDGSSNADFTANFQVGANKGQSFSIQIDDMRSKALGITGNAGQTGFTNSNSVTDGTNSVLGEASLDVSSSSNAANAIQVINNAIEKVSSQRSQLGAYQNRLEHTINNLTTSSQNLTAAESRIRDVDMAKEMMQFTKNNILNQAAQAMLSQANQQPQGVLQLLR